MDKTALDVASNDEIRQFLTNYEVWEIKEPIRD
jgi:hypothetical protein